MLATAILVFHKTRRTAAGTLRAAAELLDRRANHEESPFIAGPTGPATEEPDLDTDPQLRL